MSRIAVIGFHGHGAGHLQQVLDQHELAVAIDPRPPSANQPVQPWAPDLAGWLAAGGTADAAIVCTPIHTHAPLAAALLEAGIPVLLEKPPTATLAEFEELCRVQERTGVRCQVGFQSLGSNAVAEIAGVVESGEIGEPHRVAAVGTWLRTRAYYARSRWAGRRTLDGVDVVDGVVTNPLAHAVSAALRLAGARLAPQVREVEVELWRAHDIEADDTSAVRVQTTGLPVSCGLTLTAPEQTDPWVAVLGSTGEVRWYYTTDRIEIDGSEGSRHLQADRVDLLDDLLAAPDQAALLNPLADNGAFQAVMEAVRTAPAPGVIDPRWIEWRGVGDGAHPVVGGVVEVMDRVARQGLPLAAAGALWV